MPQTELFPSNPAKQCTPPLAGTARRECLRLNCSLPRESPKELPDEWTAKAKTRDNGRLGYGVPRGHAAVGLWQAAFRVIHVLDEYRLQPGAVLEVGCGTGADAIAFGRRRWEVTAVDCSPIAVERARFRAEQHDALIRFVLSDIIEFAPSAGQFDLVYDAGLYHAIRRVKLEPYLDALWRVTKPGSYYFCLAGTPDDTPEDEGPPRVRRTKSTTNWAGYSNGPPAAHPVGRPDPPLCRMVLPDAPAGDGRFVRRLVARGLAGIVATWERVMNDVAFLPG